MKGTKEMWGEWFEMVTWLCFYNCVYIRRRPSKFSRIVDRLLTTLRRACHPSVFHSYGRIAPGWDKGLVSCDNPLCFSFELASRRVGGPCVVTSACTGPPFGPPMISESNVAASSFSAEWLADTRHVNIDVLEFASAVFALLLWAHHLRDTVVDVGCGLVA